MLVTTGSLLPASTLARLRLAARANPLNQGSTRSITRTTLSRKARANDGVVYAGLNQILDRTTSTGTSGRSVNRSTPTRPVGLVCRLAGAPIREGSVTMTAFALACLALAGVSGQSEPHRAFSEHFVEANGIRLHY